MSNLVDSSYTLDALITFKNLPEEDIESAINIELASYPSDEAASLNSLTFRQKNALECFRGAYINNKLIGFICGTRTNDVRLTHISMDEHVRDGKSLCIHSVVVQDNYRKKGYGKYMLLEYIKYIEKNSNTFGIDKLLLISKIHLVHTFYEPCGFKLIDKWAFQHGKDAWYEMEYDIVGVTMKKKIVVIPGNGGCGLNILNCNWYGWFARQCKIVFPDYEIVCSNWPDAYDSKESIWIPHIKDTIGVDENSVVVGHSSGALCAMRLLETQKLKGVVLVSAAHTDLGSEHERLSGYFDRPWEFEKIKNSCEFIIQFHSTDDHLIPVQEARYVAEQLKGNTHIYHELEGKSHFFEPFDELIDVLKEKLLPEM
jgi:uncharacterized protein